MPERKPWPMRWIVLSIVLFIALSTYVNIRYRKPGPGYMPYEDTKQKIQLAHAGYQRHSVKVDRPADSPSLSGGTEVHAAAGGLPADLKAAMFYPPLLPTGFSAVSAPGTTTSDKPYAIRFRCEMPDNRRQFSDAKLYMRGDEVLIVPECEELAGELLARSRSNVILVTAPPGLFDPGTYHLVLIGEAASKAWTLQVH